MSFLSSESLLKILSSLISDSDPKNIKRGAYELSMGPEAYVTDDKNKKILKKGEQLNIPPGQFAILLTEEVVTIPATMIAFISIKADIKFRGMVNVSGFHVDPGFRGRLKFSVYNAGSRTLTLERGLPTFLIWLSQLDKKTEDVYDGKKMDQMSISPEDVMRLSGEMASPASLDRRLKKIERFFSGAELILKVVAAPIIVGLLVWALTKGRAPEISAPMAVSPISVAGPRQAPTILEKIIKIDNSGKKK